MANPFIRDIWQALQGPPDMPERLAVTGAGSLSSAFAVTDLAVGAIAAVGLAVAALVAAPEVAVDRRLASFWFGSSIRPVGWALQPAWDKVAGDYRTRDGWIRLHTNAPHHRVAALRVLGCAEEKPAVAEAVAGWSASVLEAAIVAEGGCAAEMRSAAAWAAHPQGRAVAAEPLIAWDVDAARAESSWQPRRDRLLHGLKILDLTRVLAGPIATRMLAGYGAEVLRIDPPDWDEPGVLPEVTLGKSCARLDLRQAADRAIFEGLLTGADILLHGYRPGALAGLGYDASARRALAPNLIEVSLCAYGWTGPWAERRGFDSLVQMSTGIAEAGQAWRDAAQPVPLPVQALDHATGYLMAAAAIQALNRRLAGAGAVCARLSLARTAKLLTDGPRPAEAEALAPETDDDLASGVEATNWGPARRLRPPVTVGDSGPFWTLPARDLGTAPARWA
jgi:hypothetical protein